MGMLFSETFKTITCDNGCENLDFEGIENSVRNKRKRTKVYYAHRYSTLVKITLPRNMFKNAQETVNFYLLVITMVSVFFSIGILALMHILVVKKISTIKSIIENVHSTNDLSAVIMLKGNHEISKLGCKFNDMFHRLQKSDETIVTLAYYDTLTGLPN